MKVTEQDSEISTVIDQQLRTGDFEYVPFEGLDGRTSPWYSRLLTTLTLILSEDEIVYAQTDYKDGANIARFVLVTPSKLIVTDVVGLSGQEPRARTQIVSRSTLTSLEVDASMPINQEGSIAYAWPGLVTIVAEYPVVGRLELSEAGATSRNPNEPGRILALLEVLQQDLDG